MPINKIEVVEYECIKCGYKWINRVNGKDGITPIRCAKCKRTNWSEGSITPKEIALRRHISYLQEIYGFQLGYQHHIEGRFQWPGAQLIEKFLNLYPRPTVAELRRVLYGSGLLNGINSQNQFRRRGWIPHPDKPGWLKYDYEKYKKLLKQEAQKQQELMQHIIDSRTQ
jgi:hypothetical protein